MVRVRRTLAGYIPWFATPAGPDWPAVEPARSERGRAPSVAPMGPIHYFAYGSNLSRAQMADRCPTAVLVGPAVLRGHRIAFTHRSERWRGGVADVVDDPDDDAWGLLYELQPDDLTSLDSYEGYPDRYDRHRTRVQGPEGPVDEVWVYTVREKLDHVPPTAAYLDLMVEAADTFAFPDDHRQWLRGLATA